MIRLRYRRNGELVDSAYIVTEEAPGWRHEPVRSECFLCGASMDRPAYSGEGRDWCADHSWVGHNLQ